ncbi:unnamed protein product [Musa acuminata var. zebrina]
MWPKNPADYRRKVERFPRETLSTIQNIEHGLGPEESALRDTVGSGDLEFLLKINYYPPCRRPDMALKVMAHTDMSAITTLVPNHVPGLQVFKDGHWFDAKYVPDAIIVH